VSPLGVQYASVRAALESILEAPTLSDDALPPVRAPVPSEFVCPVSGTLLQDPVLCMEDGHTYERSAVAGLVEPKSLVPNKLLKALIEDWVLATNDAPSSSSGGSVVAVVRAEAAAAAPPAPSGEHASPVRPLKRPLGSSAYESDAPKRPFGEPREPSRSNFSREASLRSLGEHDRNGREGRGRSEEINGLPERWRQDNPRTRDGSALLQTPPHTEDRSSSSRRHEPWPGSDSRGSWASGLPQQQLGGADERFDHTRERRSERGSNFSSGRSSPPRLPDESRDDRRKDNSRTPRSAVEVERRSIERARNDAEHAARRYPDDKPRGGPPLPRDYASSLDQGRGHFGGSREGRLERSPPRLVASLPPSSSSSSSPMAPLRLPNGVLEHKELVRWRRDEPLERVRAKLLGDKYENINHIENECGVQLRLRGSSLATPVSCRGVRVAAVCVFLVLSNMLRKTSNRVFELIGHDNRDFLALNSFISWSEPSMKR